MTTITGTSGNDVLKGEPGDQLEGLSGDDTYIIYDPATRIVESSNAGNDSVLTFVSYGLTEQANIEYLSTADHSGLDPINLAGNTGAQTIVGNFGNNSLDGRGGDDTLIGLRGDDTYYVYSANAVVREAAGEGYDRVFANQSYVLAPQASVEYLALQTASQGLAFNLTGNAFAQTIVGGSAKNILNGGGGADTLIGLAGDDTYRVYGQGESVIETKDGGNDTVYTSGDFYLSAGSHVETISAADQGQSTSMYLLGNELTQRIIGDYGNNVLNGGGSELVKGDTLIGLDGDDTYRIFGQRDVVLESAGGGNDIIFTSGNYQLAAGVEVETLSTHQHNSTLAMNLTGNELNNLVIGNFGANRLDGGGGSDTLIGFAGDDVFRFAATPTAGAVVTIQDYNNGADVILLDTKAFTAIAGGPLASSSIAIGAAAADADDRIIYNSETGALSYDADGNGSGAAIQFAQIGTGLTASDLRIVAADIQPEVLTIDTPGTYLIGNAIGTGTQIPESVTTLTFEPYGLGYFYDLIFGPNTSNGVLPSIAFETASLPGTLDFSQLGQGIVVKPDEGVRTASDQILIAEPPQPNRPAPFAQELIGTSFDDVIDRSGANGYNLSVARGGAGNDYIAGSASIDGGTGNDYLVGTINTTMTGGEGADIFQVFLRTRTPGTNTYSSPNYLTDFNPAEDKIYIELNYFRVAYRDNLDEPGALSDAQFGIGAGPTTAEQRIIYNPETGELQYFISGNAGSPAGEIPLFAILPKGLDLSAENFMLIAP